MEKCICNINGYPVKDSTARETVNALSTQIERFARATLPAMENRIEGTENGLVDVEERVQSLENGAGGGVKLYKHVISNQMGGQAIIAYSYHGKKTSGTLTALSQSFNSRKLFCYKLNNSDRPIIELKIDNTTLAIYFLTLSITDDNTPFMNVESYTYASALFNETITEITI